MHFGIFSKLVGQSDALNNLILELGSVDDDFSAVGLIGEASTDKESVAYELHLKRQGEQSAFIVFSPALNTDEVIEAELLGYEPGAFAGAISAKDGVFAQAEGGSLFIDGFDNLSLDLQESILNSFVSQSFTPLGSAAEVAGDFILILGLSSDPGVLLAENKVVASVVDLVQQNIYVPSLAERREDIPALLQVIFAEQVSSLEELPQFDDAVLEALQNYSWPGNILELENFAQSLIGEFSGKTVMFEDLPARYSEAQSADQLDLGLGQDGLEQLLGLNDGGFADESYAGFDLSEQVFLPAYDFSLSLKSFVDMAEVTIIEAAIAKTQGNVSRAAELLKTKRTTLIEKMRKFNIEAR